MDDLTKSPELINEKLDKLLDDVERARKEQDGHAVKVILAVIIATAFLYFQMS